MDRVDQICGKSIARFFKKFKGPRITTYFFGSSNLFDFKVDRPIANIEYSSRPDFDAGFAGGPVLGRNIYAGFRYRLMEKKEK